MLKRLSGNKHLVLSSYIIISKEIEITKTVKSVVYFNELDDELIKRYIATNSPMDKAGAYGIQDNNFNLVKKINGSFNNVKGLPIEQILKDIKKYKINLQQK
jgi:septum formation protein